MKNYRKNCITTMAYTDDQLEKRLRPIAEKGEEYGQYFWGEIPPEQRGLDEMLARFDADKKRMAAARKKAKQKAYRQSAKGKEVHRVTDLNKRLANGFVGVDGEGAQDALHDNGAYLLLRAGNDYLHTGAPLHYLECFDFLASLPYGPNYVAYFFDYDVTMMCRQLPPDRLKRLMNVKARTRRNGGLFPVDVDGYQIDYRPGKEFKIRREGEKHWIVINDVGSFFQCSFVKALEAWDIGTPEQIEKVKAGKASRSDFTEMTEIEIEYNRIECELLAELMALFGKACRDIRFMPRKWQGPGELAASVLDHYDISGRRDLHDISADVWQAANDSYYGGRFETTAVGNLPSPLYQWDINSAYPDSIRKLPCLLHGRWKVSQEPTSDLALCYVHFSGTSPQHYLMGLPMRTEDGHIRYPHFGRGWYWLHELKMARHQTFDAQVSWSYHKECDCEPFDFVEGLYTKRKAMGKGKQGITIKLLLNSLYGKMAQSIGKAPFANPIYASLITSLTRTKLYEKVHELSGCDDPLNPCGHNVYSLATDGLFAEVSGDSKAGLGEWEVETIADPILLVQPGVYLGAAFERVKTRGIPLDRMKAYQDEFRMAWQEVAVGVPPKEAKVTIFFHQFLGLKQGVHFNRLHDTGKWTDIPRDFTFDWRTKRTAQAEPGFGDYLRTKPYTGDPDRATYPYQKDIGHWKSLMPEWYEMKRWQEAQPEQSTANEHNVEFNL
jgi:hypothetical protein